MSPNAHFLSVPLKSWLTESCIAGWWANTVCGEALLSEWSLRNSSKFVIRGEESRIVSASKVTSVPMWTSVLSLKSMNLGWFTIAEHYCLYVVNLWGLGFFLPDLVSIEGQSILMGLSELPVKAGISSPNLLPCWWVRRSTVLLDYPKCS